MGTLLHSPRKKSFVLCFSAKDADGKSALAAHLAPLVKDLTLWSVDQVPAGEPILPAFREAVASADAVLLLLSADFFAELTQPCLDAQVAVLRQQHQERGLQLIPLVWRECEWRAADWLADLKPLPAAGPALRTMKPALRDQAFANIARLLAGRTLYHGSSGEMGTSAGRGGWLRLVALIIIGALGGMMALLPRANYRPSEPSQVDASVPTDAEAPMTWKVEGIVRDQRAEPLSGVIVSLPELGVGTITTEQGFFRMTVAADYGRLVLLRAEKPASVSGKRRYRPQEVHINLGSTKLAIQLEDNR